MYEHIKIQMELFYNDEIDPQQVSTANIHTHTKFQYHEWVSSFFEQPKTLQAITNILDYPPILDGKTLLLKIPHFLLEPAGQPHKVNYDSMYNPVQAQADQASPGRWCQLSVTVKPQKPTRYQWKATSSRIVGQHKFFWEMGGK